MLPGQDHPVFPLWWSVRVLRTPAKPANARCLNAEFANRDGHRLPHRLPKQHLKLRDGSPQEQQDARSGTMIGGTGFPRTTEPRITTAPVPNTTTDRSTIWPRGRERVVGPYLPHADVRAHPSAGSRDRDGGRHLLPSSTPHRPRRLTSPAMRQAGRTRASRWADDCARLHRGGPRRPHHLVQVPIVLGRGVRLWDGLEALEADYAIEAVSTASGVTHLTSTR